LLAALAIAVAPGGVNASHYEYAPSPTYSGDFDVGLTHGDQAYPVIPNGSVSLNCMRTAPDTYVLGDHNVNQINAAY
jgi:hypothetical protein